MFWPGASAGIGAPDRPARSGSPSSSSALGAPDHPPRRLRRRPAGAPGEPRGGRRDRVAGRGAAPAGRRPRGGRPDPARLRRRRDAGRASRSRSSTTRTPCAHASRSPATGWPSASTRGRSGSPRSRGDARRRRRLDALVDELVGRGVAPLRARATAGTRRTRRSLDRASSDRHDADVLVAGGVTDLDGRPPPARRRRRGHHPRRGAPVRGHRLPHRPGGCRMTRPDPIRPGPHRRRWRSRSRARRRLLAAAAAPAPTAAPAHAASRRPAAPTAVASAASAGTCPAELPDGAARAARPPGEKRTVTIETEGRHRDRDRRPTCRRSPPATSSRSPSAAATTASCSTGSCPGFVIQGGDGQYGRSRTSTRRGRHGRPGVHDQGRAGHRHVQPRHGRDGPHRARRTPSARSSSSSLDDAAQPALASRQHLPDHRRR